DTNDSRESAAIYVADDLINERAQIAVFDPKVARQQIIADLNYLESRAATANEEHIETLDNAYETCKNAHAIAVLTEWDEFKELDWQKIYDGMYKPAFVFDGRNLLDKNKLEKIGFIYKGIGS
ncbi:MAG: nucleotide sugar dehydrogenase, partial [Flavobacterium sp.]|nr:nucleotide sugar dehydrogenase [Flavobacterium sp.]